MPPKGPAEFGLGTGEIVNRHGFDIQLESREMRRHSPGQTSQDLVLLGLLLAGQHLQFVGQITDRCRLDEDRLAAPRAGQDRPIDLMPVGGLDRQAIAPVLQTDQGFLQAFPILGRGQESVQFVLDPAVHDFHPRADLCQTRAGRAADPAVLHGEFDLFLQFGKVGDRTGIRADLRGDLPEPRHELFDLAAPPQQVGQGDQGGRIEDRPPADPFHVLRDIGESVQGHMPHGIQNGPGLGGLPQHLGDRPRIRNRP